LSEDNDAETPRPWTRRDLVKLGLAAGGAAAAGGLGVGLAATRLKAPTAPVPQPQSTIRYTRFPTDEWWNALEGQSVKVTDFQEWQGATGVWDGEFVDGKLVAGTGYPVLIIRVKRDDSVFSAPTDVAVPSGFNLYYDDPARDIRIVVVYDRCAHLCCYPGWQVVQNPPPARDYLSSAPTYQVFGIDPIYCLCHGSQYDPMLLVKNLNDKNGVEFVGPSRVHGPASRAIPVFAVRAVDDVLQGAMVDARWYAYC